MEDATVEMSCTENGDLGDKENVFISGCKSLP